MLAKAFDLEGHKKRSKERGDDPNYVPDFVDVMLEAPFENGKPLPERDICKLLEVMDIPTKSYIQQHTLSIQNFLQDPKSESKDISP